MSLLTGFIVALLLVSFLLECGKEILNVRHVRPDLPGEFQGIYDASKYRESQAYLKESTRAALIRGTFWVTLTCVFIAVGGFEWVDRLARAPHWGEIGSGLLFAGILGLAKMLLNLPFDLHDTFVLEQKYGFNRTTPGTFASDRLKGLALAATLGGGVFAALIAFFEKAGSWAWLISWIALTAFQLILAFVAPVWIMPLFNKFDPLPEGELKQAIQQYASRENFGLSGVFTMDGSKRSTKSNAFFTGFGHFRRLVLFDTLVKNHSTEELVAVLAHEIGHFKRRHILKSIGLSILGSGVLFYILSLFIGNPTLFGAFRMSTPSIYGSLILISLLYGPILRPLSLVSNGISRRFEFEADEFAVRTYGQPGALIEALKKLSRDNLSNLTPHRLKVAFDYTHPPIQVRIERIRRLASN